MKRIFGVILLCFCLAFTACEEDPVPSEPAFLYSEWTHAFEEQQDANAAQMIFRISTSQSFAPSRFRQSYIFNADGTCSYLFLDPADAHHFRAGSFEYNTETRLLTIFDAQENLYDTFRVAELSRDKLVMERQ